jgi:hypothetical protein
MRGTRHLLRSIVVTRAAGVNGGAD